MFQPNQKVAIACNQNMHHKLYLSLMHIQQQLKTINYADEAKLSVVSNHLKAGKFVSPEVFGWYYSLVFSLLNNDLLATKTAFDKLAEACLSSTNKELCVKSFAEPEIIINKKMYMQRLGEYNGFDFLAPPEQDKEIFRCKVYQAIDLIKTHLPEHYAEIKHVIHSIYLISCHCKDYQVNGAAPFQLWRLVFLRVNLELSVVRLVESLVHESAHMLLFGHSLDEPLTLNDKNEQQYSTFRQTKRPIDGIYHGVFVVARVCLAMNKLMTNQLVSNDIRDEAKEVFRENHYNYLHGYKTLEHYAQLSSTGKSILDSTSSFMSTLA